MPRWLERFRKPLDRLVPVSASERATKIAVRDVGHSYGKDLVALQNVNLDIRQGEFVCLLGPSGCGKTTLLYALAGHLLPSGGKIDLDGAPIGGPSPERLLMFQEPALYPWLTVKQNIKFVLGTKRLSRAQREARAVEHIRLVHLEGFADAMPHELSGGMKMRASLARALAMDSAVLLMDEPFGALDAQTRSHMHALLQSIWLLTRKTVVFVTHNVDEAVVLATRVVVMAPRPGRIIADLEVDVPMPREPDDAALIRLGREIRDMLRGVGAPSLSEPPPPTPVREDPEAGGVREAAASETHFSRLPAQRLGGDR